MYCSVVLNFIRLILLLFHSGLIRRTDSIKRTCGLIDIYQFRVWNPLREMRCHRSLPSNCLWFLISHFFKTCLSSDIFRLACDYTKEQLGIHYAHLTHLARTGSNNHCFCWPIYDLWRSNWPQILTLMILLLTLLVTDKRVLDTITAYTKVINFSRRRKYWLSSDSARRFSISARKWITLIKMIMNMIMNLLGKWRHVFERTIDA